jgi:hypothetical protein
VHVGAEEGNTGAHGMHTYLTDSCALVHGCFSNSCALVRSCAENRHTHGHPYLGGIRTLEERLRGLKFWNFYAFYG